MSTPGIDPGLSRPQRDVPTNSRCGLRVQGGLFANRIQRSTARWRIGRHGLFCYAPHSLAPAFRESLDRCHVLILALAPRGIHIAPRAALTE